MFVSNAQVTVEIELDLTGYIDPAEPMTRDYPGCDALVQDIDVDYAYIRQSYYQRDPSGVLRSQFRNINILDGVDMKSKDVQRLLSNILEAQAAEVEGALMENA